MSPILPLQITQEDWGTGNIVVSNFKDNVISFGGSADGITSNQLAAIDIGGGAEVTINSGGQISEVTKSDLMIVGISDPDGGDDGTVKTIMKLEVLNYMLLLIYLTLVNMD